MSGSAFAWNIHWHGRYLGAICGITTVATTAPDFTKPSAKGFTNSFF